MRSMRLSALVLLTLVFYADASAQAKLDKSAKMQTQRKAIIDGMIKEGYYTEVVRNGATMPRAWVTSKFTAGNFKDKERVLSVIYAYYFDGTNRNDSVAVIDAKTGKEIGRYGFSGLNLK